MTPSSLLFISIPTSNGDAPPQFRPYQLPSPQIAFGATSSFALFALISGDVISLSPSLSLSADSLSSPSAGGLFHNVVRKRGESESEWRERLLGHVSAVCAQSVNYPGYSASSSVTLREREDTIRQYVARLLDPPQPSTLFALE